MAIKRTNSGPVVSLDRKGEPIASAKLAFLPKGFGNRERKPVKPADLDLVVRSAGDAGFALVPEVVKREAALNRSISAKRHPIPQDREAAIFHRRSPQPGRMSDAEKAWLAKNAPHRLQD